MRFTITQNGRTAIIGFRENGYYATLSYPKGVLNFPIGLQIEINGSVWRVTGVTQSVYVKSLMNVALEKELDG